MGSWGTGIFEADIAMDVREDYNNALKYSANDDEALEIFINEYKNELSDSDDGPVVWLALAKIMWKSGWLNDFVKEKAVQAVKDDLKNWEIYSEKDYRNRKKNLDKFIAQLMSPQPETKIIKRVPPFVCDWKHGDAFLLKDKGRIFFRYSGDNKCYYLQNYGIVIIFDKIIHGQDYGYKKDYLKVFLKFSENNNVSFEDINDLPYMFSDKWVRYEENGESYFRIEREGRGYAFGMLIKGTDFSKKLKYLGNCSDSDFPENSDDYIYISDDTWRIFDQATEKFITQYFGTVYAQYNDSRRNINNEVFIEVNEIKKNLQNR